jgi:hypothetical protein
VHSPDIEKAYETVFPEIEKLIDAQIRKAMEKGLSVTVSFNEVFRSRSSILNDVRALFWLGVWVGARIYTTILRLYTPKPESQYSSPVE